MSLDQPPNGEKAPGVFVAEKTAALPPLRFAASAGCVSGVLEATHEDMRAGVFTADLLLSCVASENLHTSTHVFGEQVTREALPGTKRTHRMLSLRTERTDGLNAASSFPAGLFGGALAAGSTVCLRFSSAALLLGAGLTREAPSVLCGEKPKSCSL